MLECEYAVSLCVETLFGGVLNEGIGLGQDRHQLKSLCATKRCCVANKLSEMASQLDKSLDEITAERQQVQPSVLLILLTEYLLTADWAETTQRRSCCKT
jgi:hypothetical protein